MGLGAPELILIFLVILLVFGANRIPEIARGMGKGIREFKDATSDFTSEIKMEGSQERQKQVQQPQPPQQGTPQARGGTPQARGEHAARQGPPPADTAPQEPARADNPGDADEKSKQQTSS